MWKEDDFAVEFDLLKLNFVIEEDSAEERVRWGGAGGIFMDLLTPILR